MILPFVRVTLSGWENVNRAWAGMPLACELYIGKFTDAVRKAAFKILPEPSFRRIHPLSKNIKIAGGLRGEATRLRNTLDFKVNKLGLLSSGLVFLTAAHAKWYTFGTRPHVIEARRGKTLTIYLPGYSRTDRFGWIHAKSVKHPGTPGHNWRNLAVDGVKPAKRAEMWRKSMDAAAKRTKTALPEIAASGGGA